MGAGRRPILPAPTDSSAVESAEEEEYTDTGLGTDLATDLTTRTYSTSKTIPADGTPITIPTGQGSKRSKFGRLSKAKDKSHTSLLIEYFEEGPDGSRRPSVRVKIPESARRPGKGEDHIVLTETHGPRKVSRNISLASNDPARITNPGNFSSLASLEGRQRTGPEPIEVELLGREDSEISQLSEARYIEPTSDISSMPADSVLEGRTPRAVAIDTGDRGVRAEEVMEEETLKVPRQPYAQEPSRSTERLTQKVIEKIQNKPRTTTSGTRRRHGETTSSRSRSVSKDLVEGESRRRSGKGREDASLATESSLASNSVVSANPRSLDAGSVRSGTSQGSSITNPRLLHTVEDAIRRLILPELNQMKSEQRKISGSKRYDKHFDSPDMSESSISREDVSRRVSKRRTSDNPKVSRSGSRDTGEVLSSGRRRHSKKHRDGDLDSPSERSYRRRESVDSVSVDSTPAKSSKRRHRDLAAAALAGGALTAAALKHHEHDSRSDVDRRERRRKHRSKSRSSKGTSESIAESEDIFHKHEVPPMPLRSDLGSEVTRSSLLSEKTADTMTPPQQSFREVVRGSPREVSSPTSSTPKQTPGDQKRGLSGLGMHHSNFSDRNLSGHNLDEHDREAYSEDNTPSKWGTAAAGVAGAGVGALVADHFLEDPERAKAYEANLHHQHPIRRGLSPIQSVASYQTTEPNRNSVMHSRSIDSLNSPEKQQQLLREEPSYNSFSSANSIDQAKRANQRPLGIHMENPSEVLAPHQDKFENSRDLDSQHYADDHFYDEQHDQNERYRDSYASSVPRVDARRMTNYTDDSMDAPYLDKVTAGQQVARGYGANPEYVHTPPGVESAVASLYDPSLVDVRSNRSPTHSYSNSVDRQVMESPTGMTRELQDRPMGSPLKQTHPVASTEPLKLHSRGFVNSPVQSITESFEQRERDAKRASQSPVRSPAVRAIMTQDQKDATSPESEITTNPSIIQGPIGGVAKETRDHWPYDATPPTNKYTITSGRDIAPTAAAAGVGAMIGASAAQAHMSDKPRGLHIGNTAMPPSPGAEDEGYITGVNPKSPEMYADKTRDLDNITPANEQMEMPLPNDDPFTAKKGKYLSGFSQGMSSPLYDSSTGQGMDRIQSKDIVALMDHLTVRDAQRNARDTEILVTLVRSAAEMRNSFEDMKKFITDTGDEIMDTGDKQHEQTQKVIGGPRPQPQSTRSLERTPKSQGYHSDEPGQRKNVFKRALQGLGSKNKAELQNIETMLIQLLDEVEGLRSSQGMGPGLNVGQINRSINSAEHVRAATDPGYEPEGQAGTSSTGVGNSGFFSNDSSRQDHYRGATGGLRESGNRVSTVMEGDEEYANEVEYEGQRTPNQQYPNGAPYGSPSQEVSNIRDINRGKSEPLRTPPRVQQQEHQVHFSNENTPNLSNSGGKAKHKSVASSFFPRISRWSKTTASSITDNFRSSGLPKQRPYSEMSRAGASGEHIDDYDYDPRGDDRLRSNNSFANDEQYRDQENRPPSPLIPSQVSEKPKYQAVRNSINLEHPQPRQGPTGRYQHHLENEAQTYAGDDLSPTSQTSSQWNQQGHGALNSIPNSQGYSQNRELSPVSYSDTSSAMRAVSGEQGRPRSFRSAHSREGPTPPPKVRDDDDPLVPARPPKVAMTPPNNRPITYADQVAVARAGSPAYTKSPVAALLSGNSPAGGRKPSGPRPIMGSGSYKKPGDTIKRTRFRGSPNQIDSDDGENFENVVTSW